MHVWTALLAVMQNYAQKTELLSGLNCRWSHRCQGMNVSNDQVGRRREGESNLLLSFLPPAPASAPASESAPPQSGPRSGKSHFPPARGSGAFWEAEGPPQLGTSTGDKPPPPAQWRWRFWRPAAFESLCVRGRSGTCRSLRRRRSPFPSSAGVCRPACPRWRRTHGTRCLHAIWGSCFVRAGSWCRWHCRWKPDDSAASSSSCLTEATRGWESWRHGQRLLDSTQEPSSCEAKTKCRQIQTWSRCTHLITRQTTTSTMMKMTNRAATTLRMVVSRTSGNRSNLSLILRATD